MFLTGTFLSRREVLRGLGATVALPWLAAMAPARGRARCRGRARIEHAPRLHRDRPRRRRLFGDRRAQELVGAGGDRARLRPVATSLRPLEPFRDRLTIVSNTDVDPAEPFTAQEIGGDHFRSSAVFLTRAHPKQTAGGDVRLQVLAFASDITRVVAFKFGRDASNRVFPDSGNTTPFHNASHHGGKEAKIVEFAKINTYHVSLLAYLLTTLQATPHAGGSLLDDTVVLYGSPMGDPNLHNHKRVPFVIAGRAGNALRGGVHLKAPNATPLANAMLAVLHAIGLSDLERFGDSDGVFDLNPVAGDNSREFALECR